MCYYKMSKELIKNAKYKDLSVGAKVVYMLLLDRYSLSVMNNYTDEEGRICIHYPVKELMDDLGFSRSYLSRCLTELSSWGFIEKRRRNKCLSDYIYVNELVVSEEDNCENNIHVSEIEDVVKDGVFDEINDCVFKNQPMSFEDTSVVSDKVTINKTKYNKTKENNININNNTEISVDVYPSYQSYSGTSISKDEIDRCKQKVKENIDYEYLCSYWDRSYINSIVDILTSTLCSRSRDIYISSQPICADKVKEQLLKLRSNHVEYVMECMEDNSSDIKNIRKYLLTCLYNAPETIEPYYENKVNSGMRMIA